MSTQPAQSPHDPRILQHPEYARSYQHYLAQGAPVDEAARRAYEWTAQHIAAHPNVAAPPKKKTNHVLIGVVVGILALCGIGGIGAAMFGGSDTASVETTDTAAPTSEKPAAAATTKPAPVKPKAPGIGSPVRDGQFEFVVKSQKCGVAQVGGEFLNKTAQGQFCLVTMVVKNIGDEPRTFDDSNQVGYNAAGAKYSADGAASLYANENNETFLNEINPGNQVTGTVVFDIPKGGKIARLELHDSPFSGGVEVTLWPRPAS